MRISFRKYHLLQILKSYETKNLPIDIFLKKYFKLNRSIGSKDRKEICQKIYTLIRWRLLIEYLSHEKSNRDFSKSLKKTSLKKESQASIDKDLNTYHRKENIDIHYNGRRANFLQKAQKTNIFQQEKDQDHDRKQKDQDTFWEDCLDVLEDFDYKKHLNNESIPLHIRYSFPKELFELLKGSFSLQDLLDYCLVSNSQAPTTIRTNLLKISSDKLFDLLSKRYPVRRCKRASAGITFDKKENFFTLEEFKRGYFEIQDEGSQLVAELIDAKPKDHILDYCAGSGGKSLALASLMQKKGQIYLHDIRESILLDAKKRFKRAGVENYQVVGKDRLKKLKSKMDIVILDVPCSGTGTLRRNVDLKWRLDRRKIEGLVNVQREVFEEGLKYVKVGGNIVYITCSVLEQENQEQVEYFVGRYGLSVEREFVVRPQDGGMDGFFGCVLKRIGKGVYD